jgi:uncharacterized membrane protein
MPRGRPRKVSIEKPVVKRRGRKPAEAEVSPFVRTVRQIDRPGVSYQIVTFKKIPHDAQVDKFTLPGQRVIVAKYPDFYKIFLKHYYDAGEPMYPHGGIKVYNATDDKTESFAHDAVALHPKGGEMNVNTLSVVNTSGHRPGTAAAEKAEAREERRRLRNEKQEAKQAIRAAKKAAKQAKVDARNAKRKAREDKKAAKEAKRVARLRKKEKKIKTVKGTAKNLEQFVGGKKPRKPRSDAGKKRKKYRKRK